MPSIYDYYFIINGGCRAFIQISLFFVVDMLVQL